MDYVVGKIQFNLVWFRICLMALIFQRRQWKFWFNLTKKDFTYKGYIHSCSDHLYYGYLTKMATFLHPQGDGCEFECIFLMYFFTSKAQQGNNLLLIICFAKIWRTVSFWFSEGMVKVIMMMMMITVMMLKVKITMMGWFMTMAVNITVMGRWCTGVTGNNNDDG